MTDRLVAIGECMVEMAPRPGGLYAMGFAGDTFNTAWYARALLPAGWRVDYLTAVGTDAISDRMVAFFAGSGVDVRHVARRPDRTVGLYLIELSDGERAFAYWRAQSAARTLADDPAAVAAALGGARLAYLSGITLAILAPEARARLLAALAAARAAGTLVAFDPNIRPRLWPDAEGMRQALMAGAAVADVALPSFEDEAAHFGDPSPEATVARYAAAGCATVVVKNGPADVVARVDGRALRVPCPPVARVIDSTAAGDSFNAGFLAARLTGAPAAAAIAAGVALAARVIAEPGALAPAAVAAVGGVAPRAG